MGLRDTFEKGLKAVKKGADTAAEAVKHAKEDGTLDAAAEAAKKGVSTVKGIIKGFKQ